MDKADFYNKLNWEGGAQGLYNYGVEAEEIEDPELRKLWSDFCKVMDKATPLEEALNDQAEEFFHG